jgi:predicted DNA-binding protein
MPRTRIRTKKISFTSALRPSQHAQITALAEEYGVSQARIIRELLEVGLNEVTKGYLFKITEEHDL